ncbi:MAG: cyclodeaminase/cyclohydrolase family protein [Peptostreptococcaceae bacterium]|nr:cyclodeaminase/cyclohydrolase family protein [Peptostreptococcaceae bacterium]
MLTELKLNDFIETVASSAPAPGGGSCSSLAGALGAGLAVMMCQLTIGKKSFQEYSEENKRKVEDTLSILQNYSKELTELIDKDTLAFNRIMDAFKLPKETDDQKAQRSQAIQEATWNAIATPFRMSELSLQSIEALGCLVDLGNANAISDLGVGILLLQAGLKGANMNVKINLSSVKDADRAKKTLDEINDFEKKADKLAASLLKQVNEKL